MTSYLLAAVLTLGSVSVLGAQHSSTSTNDETLMFLSPWFGGGVGWGGVTATTTGQHQLAGPSAAGLLDVGAEIAGRVLVGAEVYGQSSFAIPEDDYNSASFKTVTAGARVWRSFLLEGGWGSGTYTLGRSQLVTNAPAMEFGIEMIGKPRLAEGSLFLHYYETHLALPAADGTSGFRLKGLFFGASLRVHLLDAIIEKRR